MRKYERGITTLENVDSEKDIGVTIDQAIFPDAPSTSMFY
jgi:hypothetical protein